MSKRLTDSELAQLERTVSCGIGVATAEGLDLLTMALAEIREYRAAAASVESLTLDELQFSAWPHVQRDGGQHLPALSYGVSVYHARTGLGVVCDSERSMQRNRERAVAMLSRLIGGAK